MRAGTGRGAAGAGGALCLLLLMACGGDPSPTAGVPSTVVSNDATGAAPAETSTATVPATGTPGTVAAGGDYCDGAQRLTRAYAEYFVAVIERPDAVTESLGALRSEFDDLSRLAPAELSEAFDLAAEGLGVHAEVLAAAGGNPTAIATDDLVRLERFLIDGRDPMELIDDHHRVACGIDSEAYFAAVLGDSSGADAEP